MKLPFLTPPKKKTFKLALTFGLSSLLFPFLGLWDLAYFLSLVSIGLLVAGGMLKGF
jgi:hypothetical protein